MASHKNEDLMREAFKPHLLPGETVAHMAFGVKQPNIGLIILLIALGLLPGLIAVALLTKHYLIALTDRRFLVLRFTGRFVVKEVFEYDLGKLPAVESSTGAVFTHIKLAGPVKPFVAKFHRMGMPNNREHSMAIAEALRQRALPARAA